MLHFSKSVQKLARHGTEHGFVSRCKAIRITSADMNKPTVSFQAVVVKMLHG